jgi:hypothetical protein
MPTEPYPANREHQCASDPGQLTAHSDTAGGMTTL